MLDKGSRFIAAFISETSVNSTQSQKNLAVSQRSKEKHGQYVNTSRLSTGVLNPNGRLVTLLHFLYTLRVENWMKNQKILSTCWGCSIFNRKSM
jgi:hypothetical protein